ncbi:MAG: AmmeMemoRadiSam system radical SAM enzyme [Planctomycetales bacterium]|nr:AmmeMemoRadiSam system radical SAM enzyme [Planctomycetales bacterium]
MTRILRPPMDNALLPDGSKLGGWWHEDEATGRMVCDLCPRECHLKPGDRGFCFVRENRDGQMVLSTYGRSTGFCIDPIEKKPLNHFYPGTSVLSFGTAGCNLGCKFCQNHDISKSREVARLSETAAPDAIARAASRLGCRSVAFTYNDPVIWAEYAIDTAKACHVQGIKTVAVTAGYISEAARESFFGQFDAANVDLKGFTEAFYYELTLAHLQPVLDTLVWLRRETDVWFEITNLVIPRANDSDDEFRQMCAWILDSLGDDVPVHFTAFHPDFRMLDRERTPPETLLRARTLAQAVGLKYVYVGNVDDERHQSTYCGQCGEVVIERNWYELGAYHLRGNRCKHCDSVVPGFFDFDPGDWGRRRLPVRIAEFSAPSSKSELTVVSCETSQSNPTPLESKSKVSDSSSTVEITKDRSAIDSIQLSDVQRDAIHYATSELLTAAVEGRSPQFKAPTFAAAADHSVLGAYVSVKRQGRLRACCGFLGQSVPLSQALGTAAARSALEDPRFPKLSASELPSIDLETWLLFGMQPMQATGTDRISEVTIGRHGLRISRGNSAGLLLPGVAVDAGFDSETFLQHVCLKAGLPPTAWKDDDVQLFTFEGISIAGRLHDDVAVSLSKIDASLLTDQEMQQLTRTCRSNIRAVMTGAMPSYYVTDCSDGMVAGAAIGFRVPGLASDTMVSKLSLRPGLPMQSTLYSLAEATARTLTSAGVTASALDEMQPSVTILFDTAMHGTLAAPDLAGVSSDHRALLIAQGNRSAWRFDPRLPALALLQRVADDADIRRANEAQVYSLRVQTSDAPVAVAHRPRPIVGTEIRPPAVAGTFYPADPKLLNEEVSRCFAEAQGDVKPKAYSAAMIPHAGLVYSGRIAADVLRRIEIPKKVIVIGPKHTTLGVDWAVAPHRVWSLPGLEVAADPQLARELVDAIDGLELDATAHQREHSIEVELPLLARLAPDAQVAGIAIGPANYDDCRRLASGLAQLLEKHAEPVLLVVSTDMNHFATDAENRRLDEMALLAIEELDPRKLYDTVRENHISMCGVLPCVIAMLTLESLGRLNRCDRVAYATSADVSGDTSRVVGYAGMLFS